MTHEAEYDDDHPLVVRKTEMLTAFRQTITALGVDGRDPDDISTLLNALFDLIAMSLAAHAKNPSTTIRQIAEEALPAMTRYFEENPDRNFWRRAEH